MLEPISEVPNIIVIRCMLPNKRCVAQNAVIIEIMIETRELITGMPDLKIKSRMMSTIIIDTVDMTDISVLAELELLKLWKGVP